MARSANKGALVTVWNCMACGVRCEREPKRGQIPKWCDDCRAKGTKKQVECDHCGETSWTWHSGRYCSRQCGNEARRKPPPPKPEPIDQRGPLRRAYEEGDVDMFFAALVLEADTTSECWLWPRLTRDGYPTVKIGRKTCGLHRLVLEMKYGAPLGSQHAHHSCANAACVNPDHLQPVTHRDNVAEMLARQSYLARIRELEVALSDVAPTHPLLSVVAVA